MLYTFSTALATINNTPIESIEGLLNAENASSKLMILRNSKKHVPPKVTIS